MASHITSERGPAVKKLAWKVVIGAIPMTASLSVAMAQTLPQPQPQPQPQPAASKSSEIPELETIIVTARKREEMLIDVPTAVTAIDQAQISNLRLQDARDLITLVPTAFLQENNAGTARDISIRGVSTPNIVAEPGVAMYIDDVYSSGFISYPTQFYDLERMEVLRGPQGALYGRNAVGGAVNVISQQPTPEFGGSLRTTFASHSRQEYEGMLNVPLPMQSGVRLTGWYTDQDEGEYFNPITKKYLDASDSSGGRIVLASNPTDALALSLVGETTQGTSGGTYLYFPTDGERPNSVPRDTSPVNEYDSSRLAFKASLKSDVGDFTFVAGTRDYSLDGTEDTDLTGDNPFDLALGQLGKQTTVRENEVDSNYLELYWLSPDWGPLSLLVGTNYLDESATGKILTDLSTVSQVFTGGALPATLSIDNDQSVKSWSMYTEATFKASERVSIIGSVRYTSDDKDVDFIFTPSALLTAFVGPEQTANTSKAFTNWSPGLTLAWTDPNGWRVYGKAQTGFRAGGYNFNVANANNLPYDEETSLNLEIGAKHPFGGGAGYFGVSAYQLRQKDVLVPFIDLTAPGSLSGYLENAGDARTNGIELEATYAPIAGLSLQGSIGYLDAKFTSGQLTLPPATVVELDGNKLPSSREWTAAFVSSYRHPIANEWYGLANLAYTYRDSGYQDVANTQEISDANLLNASLGAEWRMIEVLAFVQNALDDQYEIAFGGFRPPSSTGVILATGTTYGVTLRAKF